MYRERERERCMCVYQCHHVMLYHSVILLLLLVVLYRSLTLHAHVKAVGPEHYII